MRRFFLFGLESEVSNFGRTAESEGKPTAVADVDVTEAVAELDDAARVLEDREERHAEESELRAVRVTRQRQRKISFCAVVDEFGMMCQQNFNRVVGDVFNRRVDENFPRVGKNFFALLVV